MIKTLRPTAWALLMASTALPAWAADQAQVGQAGEVKFEIHGNASIGTTIRTDNVDPTLVYAPNGAKIGITGGNPAITGAKNFDDGDLNFRKWRPVSTVLKAFIDSKVQYQNYGVVVQFSAWHDFTLGQDDAPHGHMGNAWVANSPLSDSRFDHEAKFSGVALKQAYAFANFGTVDVKFGEQRINWGLPSLVGGGLAAINGVDFAALHRPGFVPQEAIVPLPAFFTHVNASKELSFEGWVAFKNTRSVLDGCGTFYSNFDYVAPGCDIVQLPGVPDSANAPLGTMANRYYVDQGYTPEFGLGAQYKPVDGVTLGAYFARQNWRTPSLNVTRGTNPAFPYFNPATPATNPTYALVFAEQVDTYALNATASLPNTKTQLSAEVTYRPNQPFNLNNTDILNGALSPLAPSLLRGDYSALPVGGVFSAFDTHQTLQMNFGGLQPLPGTAIGAKSAYIGAEVAWKHVIDLPDQNVRRYGRIDYYGQGQVNGVCAAATIAAGGCNNKGYFSEDSVGLRVKAGVTYADVLVPGLTLAPSITYGWDISGWAYDLTISEGRQFVNLALRADYNMMFATIAYEPTWGGEYNAQRDRSTATAVVGVKF